MCVPVGQAVLLLLPDVSTAQVVVIRLLHQTTPPVCSTLIKRWLKLGPLGSSRTVIIAGPFTLLNRYIEGMRERERCTDRYVRWQDSCDEHRATNTHLKQWRHVERVLPAAVVGIGHQLIMQHDYSAGSGRQQPSSLRKSNAFGSPCTSRQQRRRQSSHFLLFYYQWQFNPQADCCCCCDTQSRH